MGVKIKTSPATAEEVLEIMPNCWESLMVFLNCQTQWRFEIGMAGLVWGGLVYRDVREVLDDMKASAHVFGDIRVMEAEALRILNGVD